MISCIPHCETAGGQPYLSRAPGMPIISEQPILSDGNSKETRGTPPPQQRKTGEIEVARNTNFSSTT